MIKETITYEDYDGNTRTEDYWFHLNKVELITLQQSEEGGIEKYIERLIQKRKGSEIIEIIKDFIKKSYGEKSLDGKTFVKNKEILDSFVQSEAYPVLFMKLATDDNALANFIKGIIPKDLAKEVEEMEKQMKNGKNDNPVLSVVDNK